MTRRIAIVFGLIFLFVFIHLFLAHERMVATVRRNIEHERAQIAEQLIRTNEKARIILALQDKKTFRFYADVVYHVPKLRYYSDDDQIILAEMIDKDLGKQYGASHP